MQINSKLNKKNCIIAYTNDVIKSAAIYLLLYFVEVHYIGKWRFLVVKQRVIIHTENQEWCKQYYKHKLTARNINQKSLSYINETC